LYFLTEVGRRFSAMRVRRHSCFSASLSHFNGSMRYSYTSLLSYPTSSRTSSHSNMYLATVFSLLAFYTIVIILRVRQVSGTIPGDRTGRGDWKSHHQHH